MRTEPGKTRTKILKPRQSANVVSPCSTEVTKKYRSGFSVVEPTATRNLTASDRRWRHQFIFSEPLLSQSVHRLWRRRLRLTEAARSSPAAKTPARLVSSKNGWRRGFHCAELAPCGPVRTEPLSSVSISSGSQSVHGPGCRCGALLGSVRQALGAAARSR